jgi:hypothetical protein
MFYLGPVVQLRGSLAEADDSEVCSTTNIHFLFQEDQQNGINNKKDGNKRYIFCLEKWNKQQE